MLKVVLLLPKKLLLLQWTTTIANSRWGNALSHPRLHECSFPFPFSQLQPFLLRQQNGLEGLGWGLGDWVLPTPSCFVCRSRALLASSSGYVCCCCCTINSTATREMHFRSKGAFREMNSLLSRSLFPCKRWALIVRKAKNIRDSITQLGFLCLQDGNLMQWPICISGSFTQNSTLYNSFSIPKKSTLFESNKVRPTKQPKYAKPNRSYRHQR